MAGQPKRSGGDAKSHYPIIDFDSDGYWRDPYATYRQLRRRYGAVKNSVDVLEILRYRDVEMLLRDKRIVSPSVRLLEAQGISEGSFYDWWRLLMFQNEGAAHSRLRRSGAGFLSRNALTWAATRSQELADELLDPHISDGRIDILADFGHLLPVMVVCDLLGIPPENYKEVAAWSDDIALGLSIAIAPASVALLNKAVDGLCRVAFDGIRNNSALSRPHMRLRSEEPPEISQPELVALISNMLYAGHLTTKNLIGNGILALLRNPDQSKLLATYPHLIQSAVEEFLRYDAPVTGVVRQVASDVSLAGIELEKDRLIFLSISSANRDPDKFPDPDRLDITRKDKAHLAFGWAVHHCLGAPLARVEAAAAISAFLRRCMRPRLADQELQWRRLTRIRGLESLVVHFEPA